MRREKQKYSSHEKQIASMVKRSMLEQAAQLHDRMRQFKQEDTGKDNLTFLQRPYARVQTEEAVTQAPVWFTAYMPSIIGREQDGEMVRPLETLCDLELWKHFADLGISAVHTGPVMKAGGFSADGKPYKSIDGWFDPVSLEVDPDLGDDRDYSRLVWIAENMPDPLTGEKLNGAIIGDIVPGHTGMGTDFFLALSGAEHYPGLFVLTRVDQVLNGRDRRYRKIPKHILAALGEDFESVSEDKAVGGETSRLLTSEEIEALTAAKVIPGSPQRAMGVQAGFGWSITREICGVPDSDGITGRRWIYLHFFHPKQPTLNFFDSGYAAWRLTTGQLNYIMWNLRSTGVRLDANAFLGIEPHKHKLDKEVKNRAETQIAPSTWSEAHPLSQAVTNMLAWQARRLGGFSFQEMNMTVPDIAQSGQFGPDLAYDFIARPACQHAVLTGDTSLLSFMYGEMKRNGISPMFLVHALQNHDEFTYELVHLNYLQRLADAGNIGAIQYSKTADEVRAEMRIHALNRGNDTAHELRARRNTPFYNKESPNGLCTTMAGLFAARLGCLTIDEAFERKKEILQGHLLLAAFNALQPGVFALSGWDLVGALPVEEGEIPGVLLNAGTSPKGDTERDYRWVNRGAYRLLHNFGAPVGSETKCYGSFDLPEAKSLYGPLDSQKRSPDSFYSRLKKILDLRRSLNIPIANFSGVIDNLPEGVFGFEMQLRTDPDQHATAIKVLFNFMPPETEAVSVAARAIGCDPPRQSLYEVLGAAPSGDMAETLANTQKILSNTLPLLPWEWKVITVRPG